MAKKTEIKKQSQARKSIQKIQSVFNNTISNAAGSLSADSMAREAELDKLNKGIDDIINNELSGTKSITSDDMSTFLVKLFNDFDSSGRMANKTISDIFEDNNAGLFQFFQQRYQNTNMLFEDLEMITSQLFELDEAIATTRDAIITSDDISSTISRTIKFSDIDSNQDKTQNEYMAEITQMEKETDILTKLKDLVIRYTLQYGSYYVYVCPYKDLFQQHYDKKTEVDNMKNLKESIIGESFNTLKTDINNTIKASDPKLSISNPDKAFDATFKDYLEGITVINDITSIPLVEQTDITPLITEADFLKKQSSVMKNAKLHTGADGTVDTSKSSKKNKFNDIASGCYIKFIEPKKVIPVKILDHVVGYYYIHETDFQVNKAPFSTTIRVTNSSGLPFNNVDDVETMFLSQVTDKIVKQFDKPFLEKNQKFKDLILNALMYHDLYKKQIKFQYIPKEYMVRYTVNPDVNGDGQSVLMKSLFYAKLYLALLVFKMISIITRSNDTRVYYVRNSGIDQNIANQVQEVARSIKGRQINFMDLLNYNSIISKIGAYKEWFVPIGRSGEKGFDFDTIAGQDVQLNTDLMEMLRTNMINGTGVPSVIMNYINEADYAKTLTMANSKFVGRVVSLQMNLNKPTTELYRKIAKFSNMSIPDDIIDKLEFVFNPPKTLNTINSMDLVDNADRTTMAIIKSLTGENADQTPESNRLKDILYKNIFKQLLPMLQWKDYDEAFEQAQIELAKEQADKKAAPTSSSDENNSY